VPPRNKRLNRAAVPESSLDAICLRMTEIIANAVWNFARASRGRQQPYYNHKSHERSLVSFNS
jgi:hypothetical protein